MAPEQLKSLLDCGASGYPTGITSIMFRYPVLPPPPSWEAKDLHHRPLEYREATAADLMKHANTLIECLEQEVKDLRSMRDRLYRVLDAANDTIRRLTK